jgi:hypothetical protein
MRTLYGHRAFSDSFTGVRIDELIRISQTVDALEKALRYLATTDDVCICSPSSEGCPNCDGRIDGRRLLAALDGKP